MICLPSKRDNKHSAASPLRFTLSHLCTYPALVHDEPTSASNNRLPAIQRRRLSPLGQVAIELSYQLSQATEWVDAPLIFASRYGDMTRAVHLLSQLASQESLSPTQFSLSVHNAIGAIFSIAQNYRGNYTAIAAGDETMAAAFYEAQSMLASGVPAVRLIGYDAPLPQPYNVFDPSPTALQAWACIMQLSQQQGFSLQSLTSTGDNSAHATTEVGPVLNFLNSQASQYLHHGSRVTWLWQRHV